MTSMLAGLDLGQATDFSALAVVERVHVLPRGLPLIEWRRRGDVALSGEAWREEFHVRALRRWPLGTSYPVVADDVAAMMHSEVLEGAQLVVDRSGVGRAVVDLFDQAWRAGRMGRFRPLPATITSGVERGDWTVPKTDLVDGLLVPVTQGRVRVADNLPLADVLERELLAFTQRITANGRTTYEVERRAGEGHGDLAMALMLALVKTNHGRPAVVEHEETGTPGDHPWRETREVTR